MPTPLRLVIALLLTQLLAGCTSGMPANASQQQSLQTLDQASQLGSRS